MKLLESSRNIHLVRPTEFVFTIVHSLEPFCSVCPLGNSLEVVGKCTSVYVASRSFKVLPRIAKQVQCLITHTDSKDLRPCKDQSFKTWPIENVSTKVDVI